VLEELPWGRQALIRARVSHLNCKRLRIMLCIVVDFVADPSNIRHMLGLHSGTTILNGVSLYNFAPVLPQCPLLLAYVNATITGMPIVCLKLRLSDAVSSAVAIVAYWETEGILASVLAFQRQGSF